MLRPLYGHEDARSALARAMDRGSLPGSLLIHGPRGVGKQRFSLWLAQRLVCLQPGDPDPCGTCQPCRLALRLEHPDIQWFFPVVRPKGSIAADKLAEALEEVRASELATRREDPLRTRDPGEPVGIFLAQVQTLRKMAASRPALGGRRLFLIGDAELLAPQEATTEAANALLKLLEEPPAETTIVLTAAEPDGLLPTLRSRVLPVRLRPLPQDLVFRFLRSELPEVDENTARIAARLSDGSIGQALGFLPSGDRPGPLEELRREARALLEAAANPSPVPRLAAAHTLSPAGARGAFVHVLEFLTVWLRDLAAIASGADNLVLNGDAVPFLTGLARKLAGAAHGVPSAIRVVEQAAAMAHGNVNPQLITAWMTREIHRELTAAPAS